MTFAQNPQDEGGGKGLSAGLARKGRFATYHSWSELSSVDGEHVARVKQIVRLYKMMHLVF